MLTSWLHWYNNKKNWKFVQIFQNGGLNPHSSNICVTTEHWWLSTDIAKWSFLFSSTLTVVTVLIINLSAKWDTCTAQTWISPIKKYRGKFPIFIYIKPSTSPKCEDFHYYTPTLYFHVIWYFLGGIHTGTFKWKYIRWLY